MVSDAFKCLVIYFSFRCLKPEWKGMGFQGNPFGGVAFLVQYLKVHLTHNSLNKVKYTHFLLHRTPCILHLKLHIELFSFFSFFFFFQVLILLNSVYLFFFMPFYFFSPLFLNYTRCFFLCLSACAVLLPFFFSFCLLCFLARDLKTLLDM